MKHRIAHKSAILELKSFCEDQIDGTSIFSEDYDTHVENYLAVCKYEHAEIVTDRFVGLVIDAFETLRDRDMLNLLRDLKVKY